jgi:hypothetical protein
MMYNLLPAWTRWCRILATRLKALIRMPLRSYSSTEGGIRKPVLLVDQAKLPIPKLYRLPLLAGVSDRVTGA